MASYDGEIIIKTRIDSGNVANDVQNGIGGAYDTAAKKANNFGSVASKVASGLKTSMEIAAKAVAAAAAGMGAMAGYAINVGSSFSAGMSEVQAISGATGADLEALKEKAKEMGATTKFSATQSAEAMKYMAMAGWDTKSMLDGLSGVMDLAAASGEDLGSVSDIVTDSLTAFGLQASDSAHFADVLAKAASSSNTSVAGMGATFKYAAPLAGALKYSIEDVAIATGLMANSGIKAEQAGTSLRSMFTRLSSPPKEAAAALDELNVSLTDANGNVKPLRGTLEDLRNGFSGLSDAEKTEYASNIAGQEAMSGLLAIVNASNKDFETLAASIDNASGAAEKQAEIMQDNLPGALTILKSSAEGLGIEIYESIQEPLKNVVKEATSMVDSLSKAFQIGGMEGLVNEAGNIIGKILTKFSQAAPQAIKAGSDFVVSIVKGLGKNSKQLANAAVEIGKALIKGIGDILPEVVKAGQRIVVELARAILGENIANKISGFFDDINDAFSGLVSTIGDHAGDILDIVGDIVGVILNVSDVVIPALITALDFVIDNIDILKPALEGLLIGIVAFKTINTVSSVIDGLSASFYGLSAAVMANPVVAIVTGVVTAFGALAVALHDSAMETQQAAIDFAALNEEQQKSIDQAKEHVEAWSQVKDVSAENAAAVQSEYGYYQDLAEELKGIVDENGHIKEGYEDMAEVIATTLSNALGIELTIQDNTIQGYKNIQTEIDKTIEKKKAEALLNSQYAKYQEALENETQLRNDLVETENALTDKMQERARMYWLIDVAQRQLAQNGAIEQEILSAMGGSIDDARARIVALDQVIYDTAQTVAETEQAYAENKSILQQWGEAQTALANNDIPALERAVQGLVNNMVTAESGTRESLQQQVADAQTAYNAMLEAHKNGSELIKESDLEAAEDLLTQAKAELASYVNVHGRASEEAGSIFKHNIGDSLTETLNTTEETTSAMEDTVRNMDLAGPGSESMIDYNAAIKSGGDQAKKTASNIAQGIKNNISVDLTSTGKNIAQGLVNGLGSMAGTVANTALALGQLAVSKVKQGADVHSPSRATIETGGYIDEGLIIGIQRGFGRVSAAAKQLGALAIPKMPSHAVANLPIPKLATGTVIPPNSPYLAVVGDQKRGTNIEAPLDTIKQAVRDVVGAGQNWKIVIPVYLEGRQVYEAVVEENNKNTMATGQNAMMGEI